jgi:calmodulin
MSQPKLVLSEDEVIQARNAFVLYDEDGDGVITLDELSALLPALGQEPRPAEVAELMRRTDTNGDGHIDFEEFVTLLNRWRVYRESTDDAPETFDKTDSDHDGYINAEELFLALTALRVKCTPEDAGERLINADMDRDGRISREEFIYLVRK